MSHSTPLRALPSSALRPLLVSAYLSTLSLVPPAHTKAPLISTIHSHTHLYTARIPTYLAKHHTPLPKHLRLIIIIDPKPPPKDLILITRQRALELLLHLSRPQPPFQPHGPERGVVEVVDVAIDLAPGEVVAEVAECRVADRSGVEGGELGWL